MVGTRAARRLVLDREHWTNGIVHAGRSMPHGTNARYQRAVPTARYQQRGTNSTRWQSAPIELRRELYQQRGTNSSALAECTNRVAPSAVPTARSQKRSHNVDNRMPLGMRRKCTDRMPP